MAVLVVLLQLRYLWYCTGQPGSRRLSRTNLLLLQSLIASLQNQLALLKVCRGTNCQVRCAPHQPVLVRQRSSGGGASLCSTNTSGKRQARACKHQRVCKLQLCWSHLAGCCR